MTTRSIKYFKIYTILWSTIVEDIFYTNCFYTKNFAFFTPILFLHQNFAFYANFILHQKFCCFYTNFILNQKIFFLFFTPILFTPIFCFLHQKVCFFAPILIVHQYFLLHNKFCFFYTNIFSFVLHQKLSFLQQNFKISLKRVYPEFHRTNSFYIRLIKKVYECRADVLTFSYITFFV